ncbi:hypothetical protein [Paenibacillus aestuarii]|uniref:Spore coat protein n=1 Tax=Paenibacillus aestuarii TaxID=516965 RepID=A0ABW0KE44_9BACL|nr:hypothetical protein [Paenibacillus aestuarii]
MNYPPAYYWDPFRHTYYPYASYPPELFGHPPSYPESNREMPPVNTNMLEHSVTSLQKIVNDATIVLSKLKDKQIAHQLMTAAQAGNQQEVERIVHTFGIAEPIQTTYTPSAIQFKIDPVPQESHCCSLTMMLKWGR